MRKHTKVLFWYCIITQRCSPNRIPAAIQTRSLSYRLLPAVWFAWPWGQLLTLLPLHFLLSLPAASPLFSTSPPGRVGQTSVTSRPDDRQLLSASGCYCIAGLLWHKENQGAWRPQWPRSLPYQAPFLLTHTLHVAG